MGQLLGNMCQSVSIPFLNQHPFFTIMSITAVCPGGCYNGGTCTAPGRCSCPARWTGTQCGTGELHVAKQCSRRLLVHLQLCVLMGVIMEGPVLPLVIALA